MARTIREFTPTRDPWAILALWAERHRFAVVAASEGYRWYKTREAHVILEATETGVRLTAWAIIFPAADEFRIDRLGLVGFYPRLVTKERVNELLRGLGQPAL